jgi:hypothetical protein
MSIKDERTVETIEEALRYPGLQNQPDNGENWGWLLQSVRQFLRAQFGRPTGFWGSIAGKIMALTPSNQDRIRWTISLLFTINSIHFWNEPIDCLKELRKLLRPGGLIAVTLQPRSRSATDEATNEIGKEIAMNLERAGFSQVRLEIRQSKSISVACALGIK